MILLPDTAFEQMELINAFSGIEGIDIIMHTRNATIEDAESIVQIYNQGIEERIATFETQPRTVDDVRAWFGSDKLLIVVEESGAIIAFASTSAYSARQCYAGIVEFSVYVASEARGRGAGRLAMEALIEAAMRSGYRKLLARVFPENVKSLNMLRSLGFRRVGIHEKHGKLDGVWRDVVVLEKLLGE